LRILAGVPPKLLTKRCASSGKPSSDSLAEFRQARVLARLSPSGFLLLQHLPTFVHTGFQVEVVWAAQFAGILVLDISGLLQCIRRAAHATPRGRCLSSGNGHIGVL